MINSQETAIAPVGNKQLYLLMVTYGTTTFHLVSLVFLCLSLLYFLINQNIGTYSFKTEVDSLMKFIVGLMRMLASIRFRLGLAFLSLCLASGCEVEPADNNSAITKELRHVLCTTGMVGDMAKAILGPDVEVTVLMQSGVDPHLFTPSSKDVSKMASADAIIYSGLHLEAGLAGYLEKMVAQNRRVYALSTCLSKEDGLIEVADGVYDPHFWNDLQLWQKAAGGLANELSKWNPGQAEQYVRRAEKYRIMIQQLYEQSLTQIGQIPESGRILISAHDAFEYFGRSLGLEVAAVQGISTNTEASVKKIEALVERIVSQKIPAVFAESSVNDKAIRAIIEGCAQRGYSLKLGGTLYSDAMGPPGSDAETFAGMYRSNVRTIVEALR